MQDFTELLGHLVVRYIFVGYGLYSLAYLAISFLLGQYQFLSRFDRSANEIVIASGLIYSLVAISMFIPVRGIGEAPYDWAPWLQPLVWIMATQLLWLKKIRSLKILRFVLSCLLIISFETFLVIVTSVHRDFISPWSGYVFMIGLLFAVVFKVVVFVLTTCAYKFIGEKLRPRKAVAVAREFDWRNNIIDN
jgi:hypothetical protein